MFAQVFDDKNSTRMLTKGGRVEERDGVTRWKRPLVTARDRQAGWLARRKHGSFVLSCLVLRFMLDMLITRLVLKARFAWKKERVGSSIARCTGRIFARVLLLNIRLLTAWPIYQLTIQSIALFGIAQRGGEDFAGHLRSEANP